MCKKLSGRASCASNSRVLWLVAVAIGWMMTGYGGMAIGQVVGVDDPMDMADSSGDIKRIEAWVDEGNLNLTMTVYGVFAPSVDETPAGMTNRYYYHWLLDTDNNPDTGYHNSEYEGNPTRLQTPIGVDLMVQFGWRNGATNGVYAYTLDPSTGDEVELFEGYEYTIDGDTIHAVIPLADLGLTPDGTIAVSAFQEGASNGWQCDWVESVVLPLTVVRAFNPIPPTDSDDIPCDVILGWSAGRHAVAHDVYLGTVFTDVNDASRTDPRGVLVSEGQADATFDPEGLLDFGTTYYWRIDEVGGAPENTIDKGQVWTFTTEPYAYPITGVIATASTYEPGMGPDNTVNGSGLDADDGHSTDLEDMWVTRGGLPVWIQFEFKQAYKIYEMWVWNSNYVLEDLMGLGARNVTIEYSEDGQSWTPLAGVPEFAQASGLSGYTPNTTVDFGGVLAKFVRLTIESCWSGSSSGQASLSEVRFFYIPVQAFGPDPQDDATDVSVEVKLDWRPGREATSHTVYLSEDETAVADGTAAAETVTDHGYVPSFLNLATEYFWRVDEVGDAGTYAGNVWSFTTEAYVVIDDFESYNDTDRCIYDTWIDGYATKTNGSTVGYIESKGGTFGERTVLHGGRQSMPLFYDNTKSPYYSEAERTFDSSQDWTARGADTLRLYFRGVAASEGNSAQGLYVTVKDKSDKSKTVTNADAAATTATEWQQWEIPLSEFASVGVKVSAVQALAIGVGNRTNPTAGGTGVVYIDDFGYGRPLQ
ncbi:MAG TPA: discoidin domain-containing protein [Sedimentisphaerales bacterium]|jgi:hypothetical protein|nr:discoidin domain-containing protein [Sedimentisphaerales bacterium]HNU30745.1 discoidin domain-containing protein [Sedimentisphaerales bacterium]